MYCIEQKENKLGKSRHCGVKKINKEDRNRNKEAINKALFFLMQGKNRQAEKACVLCEK